MVISFDTTLFADSKKVAAMTATLLRLPDVLSVETKPGKLVIVTSNTCSLEDIVLALNAAGHLAPG